MRLSWAFLDRPSLPEQLTLVPVLERLGYRAVYTVETRLVRDGVSTLGAFSTVANRIRLVLLSNSWTRGPVLMATTLASLDRLAPGRVQVALSEYWDPLAENQGIVRRLPGVQIREYVAALRALLAGSEVTIEGSTIRLDHIRLDDPPEHEIPIHLLGTGPMMAEAAGEVADGVLLNGLVPPDGTLDLVAASEQSAANRDLDGFERPQLVNVAMADDPAEARVFARRLIARYVAHQPHIAAASRMDDDKIAELRRFVGSWPGIPGGVERALPLVDDAVVDRLMVAGTAADCREGLEAWVDAGATEIVVVPVSDDVASVARALAPGERAG
jgi:5,10-methylenetetrahydromethanopterin reductase